MHNIMYPYTILTLLHNQKAFNNIKITFIMQY